MQFWAVLHGNSGNFLTGFSFSFGGGSLDVPVAEGPAVMEGLKLLCGSGKVAI